jgi:hypothetical protein
MRENLRFDERKVETEQGRAREAPADERAPRIGPPEPPRHFSTPLPVSNSEQMGRSFLLQASRFRVNSRHLPFYGWQVMLRAECSPAPFDLVLLATKWHFHFPQSLSGEILVRVRIRVFSCVHAVFRNFWWPVDSLT